MLAGDRYLFTYDDLCCRIEPKECGRIVCADTTLQSQYFILRFNQLYVIVLGYPSLCWCAWPYSNMTSHGFKWTFENTTWTCLYLLTNNSQEMKMILLRLKLSSTPAEKILSQDEHILFYIRHLLFLIFLHLFSGMLFLRVVKLWSQNNISGNF